MDRRIMLFLYAGLASLLMYPVVSPLDSADPSKPQHFGWVALGLAITYAVLVFLLLLERMSRRRERPRGEHTGGGERRH